MLFGLFDVCTLIFLFLPFWAQRSEGIITETSLLKLTLLSPYLKITYLVLIILISVCGILTLAAQNCTNIFWCLIKSKLSLIFNLLAVIVFISSLQPYPAILLLAFGTIKLLIKKHWHQACHHCYKAFLLFFYFLSIMCLNKTKKEGKKFEEAFFYINCFCRWRCKN